MTKTRLLATVLITTLVVSACAEGAGGGGGSGEGVDFGADKSAYQAAFADVDPIELHAQSPAPKGSVTSKKFEDYFGAITEWSAGKITFDVAYSNAVAQPGEIDDALADGRLDIASANPLYEPQEYPANAALNELSFLGGQAPVTGILAAHGWSLEVANKTEQIFTEFADAGVEVLLPYYNGGSVGLFCREPGRALDSLRGNQSATSSATQTAQVEDLGLTPASIAYTEVFDSLQRGVVDCTVSSLQVAALSGFIPAAPHATIDPEAGFGLSPGTIAVSQSTWDTLPLVAQQLIYDRLDVYLESSIKGVWNNAALAAKEVAKEGGTIEPLPADARNALREGNKTRVDALRDSTTIDDAATFVDNAESAVETWTRLVEEELSYADEVDYNGFADWYTDGKVDLAPFVDAVFDQTLLDRRPA